MRHALWTGITAKKPGVLGLESPARLEHAETLSGTCHMRHALWTGITAKKPGVLGLESPARLEYEYIQSQF